MRILVKILSFIAFVTQVSCDTGAGYKQSNDEKLIIQNNGVNIDYTDTKTGDTCLLFVHGWDIDKTYWDNQVDFFSKQYRVVTIDLPGFGKSGKHRESWTVENYGADLTSVINTLDLKNVILIGHSMSGAIVVEAALKNPERVIGVVGVDNFTNVGTALTPEVKKDIAEAYRALRSNYTEVVLQYTNQSLFSPSTDSAVRKRVIYDFTHADSVIAVNVLEQNDNYPLDEKLKSLGETLYLINSNYHPTDTTGFIKYNLPYLLLSVGPTGHYPMIEDPSKFNTLLAEVINKIGKTSK